MAGSIYGSNQPISHAEPQVMHVDLNSAFATAEQQAHPSLRGRPMGVTNRVSRHCCVIAASYEAKALGIRVGMRLDEAQQICPDFVMLESDPPKYHHFYEKLCAIMKSYTPDVTMKSIDEGVMNFAGTLGTIHKRPLTDIGYEIKQRVRQELGSYVRINIGIAPNRFLAKQAAGWHKPDGLDVLDHRNLLSYYGQIGLTDLSGIASHYEARLNAAGIMTPLEFLRASDDTLRRLVFHSVVGQDWHQRLRGYEVDAEPTHLGNVGRQWVLSTASADESFLLPCFQYLAETTAKKLRYRGVCARGVLVWARFQTGDSFVQRKMFHTTCYTDHDVYQRALYLFNQRPRHMVVQSMGLTCYMLTPSERGQVSLLDDVARNEWLTEAVDEINDRYGLFTVHAANSLLGRKLVKQKIPFGTTTYLRMLTQ